MSNKRPRDVVTDVLSRTPHWDRKNAQLCRAIARSLQRTLDIDLDDDLLAGCAVLDVRAAAGGVFVCVFSCADAKSTDEVQRRLGMVVPLFRSALATELQRKRVPNLHVVAVPAQDPLTSADSPGA